MENIVTYKQKKFKNNEDAIIAEGLSLLVTRLYAWKTISKKLSKKDYCICDFYELKKAIEEELTLLSEDDRKFVNVYFSLDGKKRSKKEISKELEMTQKQIKQKLRYDIFQWCASPSTYRRLDPIVLPKAEIEHLKEELETLKRDNERLLKTKKEMEYMFTKNLEDTFTNYRIVSELKESGINTLGELADYTEDELKSIKGIDTKSIEEIKRVFKSLYGLKFDTI